jgi:putative ABC transport system permease protein
VCSIPLTLLVDALVGSLGFLAPLPLVVSPYAAALWLAIVIAASWLATLLPARRAGRMSVREALAQT